MLVELVGVIARNRPPGHQLTTSIFWNYKMEPIHIPISICRHFSGGKPRGHYILAKRLFREGSPILVKQQFVGYNGFLFVTVVHPALWNTSFKMATHIKELDGRKVLWLGGAHLTTMTGGFKIYLREDIMKAKEPGRIEGTGIFRKHEALGFECFYLEIPKITADVLLGRKELE